MTKYIDDNLYEFTDKHKLIIATNSLGGGKIIEEIKVEPTQNKRSIIK